MGRTRTPQGDHEFDDDDTELDISAQDEHDDDENDDDDDDAEDRGDEHDGSDDDDESDEDDHDDDADEGDDDEGDEEDDDDDREALREVAGEDRFVPRARLNEVLEEVRQLREQIGGSGKAPTPEPEPDFDLKAKAKERNEKLLEGDVDGASELDDEINEYHNRRAAQAAAQAAQQIIQQEKVAEAIVDIQKLYPVLDDKKSRSFDRDVLDEVVALRNVYVGRGEPMHVALRKAAKRICERIPDADRAERKPKANRNAMTLQQKREAMKRAQRTPPRMSGQGSSGRSTRSAADLDEDQLAKMPDGKFKALDAKDKARLRGDFVEPSGGRRRK